MHNIKTLKLITNLFKVYQFKQKSTKHFYKKFPFKINQSTATLTYVLCLQSTDDISAKVLLKMQLISEDIKKFYIKNIVKDEAKGKKYFRKNLSMDFEQIHDQLLKHILKIDFAFQDSKYEEFLLCLVALQPIFSESVSVVQRTRTEDFNFKWLGNNFCYLVESLTYDETETSNVENVLLLTAMLEYALGSVYLTLSQKTPPHLLRDLLLTEELVEFFGLEAITLLRILVGIPNSVNLRNIVWHGFPKPEDIPNYYVTILLLIAHSFGVTVEEKGLILSYRSQVNDFSQHIVYIVSDVPVIGHKELLHIKAIIENYTFVQPEYKVYWQRLLSLFIAKKHWNFVVLILPQIELLLRLKYAKFNDFDVTANLDEYYITMDTIFEPTVPNAPTSFNKLLSEKDGLSNGALKLMYDLFIAPNGPRIRDKVSHGEVNIEAINNEQMCHVLMYLSLNLLTDNDLKFCLSHYESKFHLNCRAKTAIEEATEALNKFVKGRLEINEHILEENTVSGGKTLKIFLRPKKESVYMLFTLKITTSLIKVCRNYEESIVLYQELLEQHELRSRRRRTFKLLLDSMPLIVSSLRNILDCLIKIFQKLQAANTDNDIECCEVLLRFLKHTLKIAENFMKYSHKESNEWIKAIELCNSFKSLQEKLCLK